ncbi:MAG: 23S rRNA (adenine(2030)-N(6))-methyltransferase RlmJ [Treponema sp.]|uniref:23S rRNA (adenine(2030)-N(6))-methyltransferase RlmJ n=1 Tax=Treponema sp. TaxID=166 RepID=UPI0025D482B2|nr:23S rRNA (adenine(2030)-N(6))-methyltransferase RlmJ [Treponema sp.]MBQ8681104.1 23S rRNA (adenine(2030)-N(6))-methyltransferase RlmJ [Treponema sp.]
MLSYIHAYHAGNHADILKHLTISLILEHLCKKEKPFTVIDTHAGSGIYDLHDERAQKTGEASSGIEKILTQIKADEVGFNSKFSRLIKDFYERGQYPGSPLIENAFLRPGDQQILSELHPRAFEELRECLYNRRKECNEGGKIFVEPALHRRDGYELLKAVTPPKIRRGLAVIDPSFEDASDFFKCGEVISAVHKKWSAGIIALWYPLVAHRTAEISMMKERIAGAVESSEPKIHEPKVLDIQMEIKRKEDMTGLASLYGSGMFIVNFPYQLDEEMKEIMPALTELLGETAREWSVEKIS